jgi:hypothetical protein
MGAAMNGMHALLHALGWYCVAVLFAVRATTELWRDPWHITGVLLACAAVSLGLAIRATPLPYT